MSEHQSEKDEMKAVLKEALQEWLDKQFATFGKWSMAGLVSVALVGLTYFWLMGNGWHK